MFDRRTRPFRASSAPWAVGALALGLLVGCGEPPSYELRWKLVEAGQLDDPDTALALSSVKQCADVGVTAVRVTTRRPDNSVADLREYPCFPGAFTRGDFVEGPSLEPGEYTVEIEGLRRTGEPWTCVDDPDTPEADPCVARDQGSVSVSEGSLPTLEFVLLSPPECDDGIDNDGDGRVDGKDPACVDDPTGPEQADASSSLFQTAVTFLGSPAVRPANVSVDAIRLRIDGETLVDVQAFELDFSQWPFRLPLISSALEPGDYQFSILAVDDQGQALTEPHELDFSVSEDQAAFVLGEFDFGADRFLEPIIEPFAATFGLLLDPDADPEGSVGSTCTLGGYVDGELATIDELRIQVTDPTDGNAQALDAAALELSDSLGNPLMAVDEAQGWISFPCPSTAVRSAELSWGRYAIEAEARIGDAVCFISDGARDLAPLGDSGAQNLALERVVDEQGAPPVGCEECEVDSDCSGQVCELGICKDKSP